jgi:hypothetical protein
MIRKCQILFCDNDHGCGDVTYPDVTEMDGYAVQQLFINGTDMKSLRKEAKEKGWRRVNGADYCPGCMESM